MLNNIHQFKILAHRLNRSRNAQEINKHVSDGFRAENKPKTAKTKEAKDFRKSEAELVDVMDTFQRVISIIEKEMAKNFTFLQKEIGTRNTNYATVALITKEDLNVNSFLQNSVNDEAYHRADHRTVPLKLGTLTTGYT